MCLLFVYINDNKDSGKYRLILANNRDEFWSRPTAKAAMNDVSGKHRWIGGRDLVQDREGGTWLGLSESGRLAVLLNIVGRYRNGKKGRGYLVRDYLSLEDSDEDYVKEVIQSADLYHPFHLIMINLRSIPSTVYYVNSETGAISSHFQGVFSCDNSEDMNPSWKKTEHGQRRFDDIVKEEAEGTVLIEKLFHLLGDRTNRNLPDPQMYKQIIDAGFDTDTLMEDMSCINVFSPSMRMGTRTRTVILVTHEGECTFIEKTLNAETGEWSTVSERVSINATL